MYLIFQIFNKIFSNGWKALTTYMENLFFNIHVVQLNFTQFQNGTFSRWITWNIFQYPL